MMSIRAAIRSATLTVGAAALVAGAATPADADNQFGEHVTTCAQTLGFNGVHNPGMHQGYSGWSPDHVCPAI